MIQYLNFIGILYLIYSLTSFEEDIPKIEKTLKTVVHQHKIEKKHEKKW